MTPQEIVNSLWIFLSGNAVFHYILFQALEPVRGADGLKVTYLEDNLEVFNHPHDELDGFPHVRYFILIRSFPDERRGEENGQVFGIHSSLGVHCCAFTRSHYILKNVLVEEGKLFDDFLGFFRTLKGCE